MRLFASLFLSALLLSACSSEVTYDNELCEELAVKIDRKMPLTQDDYAEMIEQDEAILQYLVGENERISALPDEERASAWRELQADPEYLERFGYSFTLGSTLYRADTDGLLDESNRKAFAALSKYNERL